jgi:hypothetical protein
VLLLLSHCTVAAALSWTTRLCRPLASCHISCTPARLSTSLYLHSTPKSSSFMPHAPFPPHSLSRPTLRLATPVRSCLHICMPLTAPPQPCTPAFPTCCALARPSARKPSFVSSQVSTSSAGLGHSAGARHSIPTTQTFAILDNLSLLSCHFFFGASVLLQCLTWPHESSYLPAASLEQSHRASPSISMLANMLPS